MHQDIFPRTILHLDVWYIGIEIILTKAITLLTQQQNVLHCLHDLENQPRKKYFVV